MADYNAIGNPFIASGVPRLYGVDMPRVDAVSSDVQITTSPWERPEFWALMGGSLAQAPFDMAAVAGQKNAVELRNSAGSGVLVILESLLLVNETAALIRIVARWRAAANPLSTSTGAWSNRDLRRAQTVGGSGALAARMRQETAAGTFTGLGDLLYFSLTPYSTNQFEWDLVFPPGWSLMLMSRDDNNALMGAFIGRERPLPGQEVSL